MRFLADESLEAPVVSRLREAGHDVVYVREMRAGAPDTAILRQAARESRILITNDKDFGMLAFLQRQASSGVVLLRLPRWRSASKADRLLAVIGAQRGRMQRALTVIEEAASRRRPFPRHRSRTRS